MCRVCNSSLPLSYMAAIQQYTKYHFLPLSSHGQLKNIMYLSTITTLPDPPRTYFKYQITWICNALRYAGVNTSNLHLYCLYLQFLIYQPLDPPLLIWGLYILLTFKCSLLVSLQILLCFSSCHKHGNCSHTSNFHFYSSFKKKPIYYRITKCYLFALERWILRTILCILCSYSISPTEIHSWNLTTRCFLWNIYTGFYFL